MMVMANGKIIKTIFTDAKEITEGTSLKAKSIHVAELRKAITALDSYAKNVDNCGNCAYCQIC